MNRSRAAIGTAVLTSALTSLAMLAVAPTAGAAPAPVPEPIVSGLAGPLQMDVEGTGSETRIVVAESFAGQLTEVDLEGGKEPIHNEMGYEVSGVAIDGDDTAFLTTKNLTKKDPKQAAFLKFLSDGQATKVANLFRHERVNNPDGDVRYGVRRVGGECRAKLPGFAKPYKGIVEAHPYGLAEVPGGGWYVADAAGNTILEVRPNGNVKTVAVLPRQKVEITRAVKRAHELPRCSIGGVWFVEPVPTDVEVPELGLPGVGESLVVSLLPGGEELAPGKVLLLDPATGKKAEAVSGFAAASNVAIGEEGGFVSELFGNKITRLDGEGSSTFWEGPMPAAVEWHEGSLYALIDIFNEEGGSLVVFHPELAD